MELYRFYSQTPLSKADYFHECYAAKGYLVERVTLLEYQLSFIIAFIRGKFEADTLPTDFLYTIQHEESLKRKINIAEALMKRYHIAFTKKNPKLFTLLHKIRDLRNDVAHSLLDISRENFNYNGDMKGIGFSAIESNPGSHNPNCPAKFTRFGDFTSDLTIIDDTCEILRDFLKTEYSFGNL